jgi:hypothetical protein
MNQGRIEDASSDKYLPKDLVARIEKQRVELLTAGLTPGEVPFA